jgi:hypothetical protein
MGDGSMVGNLLEWSWSRISTFPGFAGGQFRRDRNSNGEDPAALFRGSS